MGLPIALQLYTVRDEMAKDFDGTLAKVAEIGYRYVEFAGLYNRKAEDVRKTLDKLGLKACSAHVSFEGDLAPLIHDAKTFGYSYVNCPYLPAEQRTPEGYRALLKRLTDAAAKLKEHGLTVCYHNHSFEFDKLADGTRGIDTLFNNTGLHSELDVYWVQHGHDEPVAWIRKLAGRVPLLHIKDMERGPERKFTEVGTGILDMKAIVAAAPAAGVKYLIIEQDGGWQGGPIASAKTSYDNFKKIAG